MSLRKGSWEITYVEQSNSTPRKNVTVLPGKAFSPGIRFSLELPAFSPAAASVHKTAANDFRSHDYLPTLQVWLCSLNLLSASFAKSLLSSSSAVSLEKLSSPKGFQLG